MLDNELAEFVSLEFNAKGTKKHQQPRWLHGKYEDLVT